MVIWSFTLLSRSEIFALSKKATRGAGFSWGMAEEAAVATVKMYENGHDGFSELLSVLSASDGKQHPLDILAKPACGLTLGVFLADTGKPAKSAGVIGLTLHQAVCGSLAKGEAVFPTNAPEEIQAFANRTYVPDSTESRLRGAG